MNNRPKHVNGVEGRSETAPTFNNPLVVTQWWLDDENATLSNFGVVRFKSTRCMCMAPIEPAIWAMPNWRQLGQRGKIYPSETPIYDKGAEVENMFSSDWHLRIPPTVTSGCGDLKYLGMAIAYRNGMWESSKLDFTSVHNVMERVLTCTHVSCIILHHFVYLRTTKITLFWFSLYGTSSQNSQTDSYDYLVFSCR